MRHLALIASVLVMLAIGLWAQRPIIVDGSPALRFDYSPNGPTHVDVERTAHGAEVAFSVRMLHIHEGMMFYNCEGVLLLTHHGLTFRPDQIALSYGRKLAYPKCSDDSQTVGYADLQEPIYVSNAAFVLRSSGRNYRYVPSWDPPLKANATPYSKEGLPLLDFLLLAANNFPAAEEKFSRLTAFLKPAPAKLSSGVGREGNAKLTVSSDPGNAQVYVNGELKGIASEGGLALQLPAGTYHLRVVLSGYREFTHSVTLASGENKEIIAPLERLAPPPFTVPDITDLLKKASRQNESPTRAAAWCKFRSRR